MKTLDLASGLFWLFLSAAVFVESLRMGIGAVESPGMGFMPLAASALLGMLSLVLLVKTIVHKRKGGTAGGSVALLGKKALMVLIAVITYSIIMPTIGYLIGTFLVMTFLYWLLEQNGVRGFLRGMVLSLLTTTLSYYLFAVLLNCPFPAGILGF
jgi:putative tricarboxylic transport membrane protein